MLININTRPNESALTLIPDKSKGQETRNKNHPFQLHHRCDAPNRVTISVLGEREACLENPNIPQDCLSLPAPYRLPSCRSRVESAHSFWLICRSWAWKRRRAKSWRRRRRCYVVEPLAFSGEIVAPTLASRFVWRLHPAWGIGRPLPIVPLGPCDEPVVVFCLFFPRVVGFCFRY